MNKIPIKEILDFIKAHLVPLICGLVAVLAIVASFWPLGGFYQTLQTELDASVQKGLALNKVATAQRAMPQLSPDQTTPPPLDVFPIQEVIDAGVAAVGQVTTQAAAMLKVAVDANTHPLLWPGCLPSPNNDARYSFAKTYQDQTTNNVRWQKILNSCTPPTGDEVNQQITALTAKITASISNQQEAQDEITLETQNLRPQMQLARARQYAVYLDTGSMPVNPNIKTNNTGQAATPEAIWDAQLAVWLADDVAVAVARANKLYCDQDSTGKPINDILHDPIKRIEKIGTIQPINSPSGLDLTAGDKTPTPKIYPASPTGRVCNALYDVVQFDVVMDVDATKLPQVLEQLQAGQFMTVANVQINKVFDPAMAANSGYRFGDKPVVQIDVLMEELLMRAWTTPLQPPSRQNGLGHGSLDMSAGQVPDTSGDNSNNGNN